MTYSFSKKNRDAEDRQVMNRAIGRLKRDDPVKYAELLKRAQDEAYDVRVREQQAQVEQQRRLLEQKRREYERMRNRLCPVVYGLPEVDTSDVNGMVAFRVWNWSDGLKSTALRYVWRELNFADVVPSAHNQHGFYAVKLTGLDVMSTASNYFSNIGRQNVCGFVALRGRVEEHTDGVLRAEVAELICLFVSTDNEAVALIVRRLYELYPTTPVHILNPEQIADVILREVLKQRYLRQEWPLASNSVVYGVFPVAGRIKEACWKESKGGDPVIRLAIAVEPFDFEGKVVGVLFSAVPHNDINTSLLLLQAVSNDVIVPQADGVPILGLEGLGVALEVSVVEYEGMLRLRTRVIGV